MTIEDELFQKDVEIIYEFETKLKTNKSSIYNLFLTCTCTTILGTTYTLLKQPVIYTIIYPTISYMTFLHIIKEIIKRIEIEKKYLPYKQSIKRKKID